MDLLKTLTKLSAHFLLIISSALLVFLACLNIIGGVRDTIFNEYIFSILGSGIILLSLVSGLINRESASWIELHK